MNKVILNIGGMSCSACSSGLQKYLNKQKGIIDATVNLVMAQASISYSDEVTIDDINRYIHEAGFESLGIYDEVLIQKKKKNDKIKLIIYCVLAVIVMYISMHSMFSLPIISYINPSIYPLNYALVLFIFAVAFIFYGMDIFKSGIKNLIHRTPNMDTLVSIGVISSLLYSIYSTIMIIKCNSSYVNNLYFESCCIIIFFIKLGRYIDSKCKDSTKSSIKDLVTITPSKALIKDNDTQREISIDEVKKGDILIAKPGMKIAVDGNIVSGSTHIDESFITGESIPVKKSIGSKVIAGSINNEGYIEYEAVKIGRDSTISEIVKLVVEATNTKAPISRLADKVSSIFVPVVIILAILAFIIYIILGFSISEAINTFVTVLVVACPCSLGLATPLAMVISVGMCAKRGILVKDSSILENAKKIDTVVFDKTGTLTHGSLEIFKIYNYSNYTEEELMSIVSSIELNSSHPIGVSLLNYSKINNISLENVDNFSNIDGIGVKGVIDNKNIYLCNSKIFDTLNINNKYLEDEKYLTSVGCSIVYVIQNDTIIGLLGLKDTLKLDALECINKLKSMGKDIIMLTGDNKITANIIAKQLKIDNVIANVLPKDKNDVILKLIEDNKNVIMVGDGVNDAISLASATIGISINHGTDIAANSSDIILMNDNLLQIIDLINISKKTIYNIKENLFWTFFYNICMIPIALGILRPFGISMNPMIGSMAMMLSSITVTLNALRLKLICKKEK